MDPSNTSNSNSPTPPTIMATNTVPIFYVVTVGKVPVTDASTNSYIKNFEYHHQAPSSLVKTFSADSPPPAEWAAEYRKLLQTLIDAHHQELLHHRAWTCAACPKPATDLVYSAVPVFAFPAFPRIIANAIPACKTSELCGEAVRGMMMVHHEALFKKKGKLVEVGGRHMMAVLTPVCESCGSCEEIKNCTACKGTGYCSTKCQQEDWPQHKKSCKRMQAEREKLTVEGTSE